MKTMKLMLAMTIVAMTAASCGTTKEEPKTLVLYYSLTGTTKAVADEIATRLGADVEELVCIDPYDTNFQACIARCMQEREAGVLPEIQPVQADLSKYDVVLVGSPNWWGTLAPPVRTWLTQNAAALRGKTVCLFQTHGGGGMQSLGRDFAALLPESKVLPPKAFSGASIKSSVKALEEFATERISVQ